MNDTDYSQCGFSYLPLKKKKELTFETKLKMYPPGRCIGGDKCTLRGHKIIRGVIIPCPQEPLGPIFKVVWGLECNG